MIRTGRMLLAFVPAVAACASAPPPTAKVAAADRDITVARQQGALDNETSAKHLRWAEDQVATAKTLIERGDNERAAKILDRADADARLAKELNQQEKARQSLITTTSQMRSAGAPLPSTKGDAP